MAKATKKEPFGGKQAAPFGKGGKKSDEKEQQTGKKTAKTSSKKK